VSDKRDKRLSPLEFLFNLAVLKTAQKSNNIRKDPFKSRIWFKE
jgi:hypothetical protein